MEELKDLERKGYSNAQINQIYLGYKEGFTTLQDLNKTVDIKMFRHLRNLNQETKLSNKTKNILIEAANDELDISLLTPTMLTSLHFDILLKVLREFPEYIKDFDYNDENDNVQFIYDTLKTENINLTLYKDYEMNELQIIKNQIKDHGDIPIDIIKNKYNYTQLDFIFNKLNNNKLHEEILEKNYSYNEMRLISYLLDNKMSIDNISNLERNVIEQYNRLLNLKVDIGKFYNENYDYEFLYFIEKHYDKLDETLEKINELDALITEMELTDENLMKINYISKLFFSNINIDDIKLFIDKYDELEKNMQIQHIVNNACELKERTYFKEQDFSISGLMKYNYDYNQIEAITRFLYKNIDLSNYCDEHFSVAQMDLLGDELSCDSNIENACNSDYTIDEMRAIIYYNTKGIYYDNIEDYLKDYVKDKNLDFKAYLHIRAHYDNHYNDNMSEIIMRTVTKYNSEHNTNFNIEKLLENSAVRYAFSAFVEDLVNGWDIDILWGEPFGEAQRDEIKKGLEKGVDITQYCSNHTSIEEMQQILNKLTNEPDRGEER